jgi:spore coat polysaccharide biosynthesis predicted glycosyltransferase SpsG
MIAQLPFPVQMTVAGNGEALAALFPHAHLIQPGGRDLETLAAACGAAGVVVDLPAYDADEFRRPPRATPRIVIDDFGGPLQADLVINGTVLERYHHYPHMREAHRMLCGPRYALVRPAFAAHPWHAVHGRGVVIVVGSGMRARDWSFMLTSTAMDRTAWGSVTMIVGRAFPDVPMLARRCADAGIALETGLSADALAAHLAGHATALVTGGMAVYEALATGTPTVVFPLLENMVPEAAWLAQRGCIQNLGLDDGMTPAAVSAAVSRLLSNPALAKDMSKRGHDVIDGQGMARAADAIARLLQPSAR